MYDRSRPDLLRSAFGVAGDLANAKSNFTGVKEAITNDSRIHAVLARDVQRGEIDPNRLTPRIVALPTDLVRHELLMTFEPLADDAIR